jgi:hypothetical protein
MTGGSNHPPERAGSRSAAGTHGTSASSRSPWYSVILPSLKRATANGSGTSSGSTPDQPVPDRDRNELPRLTGIRVGAVVPAD